VSAPAAAGTQASGRPIRVLYLDHTARLSGGELALLRLLGALDRTRVEPVVVLAEDGPLRERLAQQRVPVHVLPLQAGLREVRKDSLGVAGLLRHARSLGGLCSYARSIARFAREVGIELIYANSLKSDLYGGLAGRLAGIPVIWHVHDRIERDYLPAPTVSAMRWLARRVPAHVVANSAATLHTLRLGGVQRACVVTPGLSAAELAPAAGRGAVNTVPRIAIVGRIAAWKGQDLFLQAAVRLREQGIAAHFLIVGAPLFGAQDLEFERQLHAFVSRHGLAGCVEFTGFTEVAPLLRTLDVLVHASRIPEPFGQVIIEGMAAELPVIATDGGGVREIIDSGRTGVLVPRGDAAALAQALAQLLSQPAQARQIARAARRHVLEHFSAERSARLSEALYAQVLGRHAA
jgi:glycosyltransferase involved in cell wall biosynthesis